MAHFKAIPVRIQEVWLHDVARPWRLPRKEMCTIIAGKKFTWAESHGGKRHLLGSTAFFMESTVMRRRKDDLCKIIHNGYLRHFAPMKWASAFNAMREDRCH